MGEGPKQLKRHSVHEVILRMYIYCDLTQGFKKYYTLLITTQHQSLPSQLKIGHESIFMQKQDLIQFFPGQSSTMIGSCQPSNGEKALDTVSRQCFLHIFSQTCNLQKNCYLLMM